MFDDEFTDKTGNPVEPAQTSEHAKAEKQKRTEDRLDIHSFDTLIAELGTLCRNQCGFRTDKNLPPGQKEMKKTKLQAKAFSLLGP